MAAQQGARALAAHLYAPMALVRRAPLRPGRLFRDDAQPTRAVGVLLHSQRAECADQCLDRRRLARAQGAARAVLTVALPT